MTYQEALVRLILEVGVQNALADGGEITIKYYPEEFLQEENQLEPGYIYAVDKDGKKLAEMTVAQITNRQGRAYLPTKIGEQSSPLEI